ncbi:uncharacterized protein E0L32_003798 [Thyridium curvatum]|uniref:Ribosome biogenesis protein SLX9 n=1 Tax=Thyridium curvatum TaxID=1093900 RepID=A0A507BCV4_9PEZI|nr:uncharacterized protein E0L32_003798 [Thyridium curvatum]TPX16504.1 hypothetical protein E0L32_003798 [Thyridium curvatum]
MRCSPPASKPWKTKAPVAPQSQHKKRTPLRARVLAKLADPTLPRKTHRESANVSDAFINSKRDRRQIKHSSFVSRIQKSHPSSSSGQTKRRRPSKKLVATLESLADALPELDEGSEQAAAAMRDGKVRHKSLKSRPGALKRKERVVKGEMARFGASLAQLAATKEEPSAAVATAAAPGAAGDSNTAPQPQPQMVTSNRWAALRGFISATMEQNPAFTNKP